MRRSFTGLPRARSLERRLSHGASSNTTSGSTRPARARSGVDMSSFYQRGRSLWVSFKDARGKWVCRPSGYKVGQEAEVRALLAELDRKGTEDGDGAAAA